MLLVILDDGLRIPVGSFAGRYVTARSARGAERQSFAISTASQAVEESP
jgi:hypothetical protein